MEVLLVSLLNGLVYGMLLFMLASGLTLIFSMMGVLNFAHASMYMLGAYFAYSVSRLIGFWPALVIAPAAVRHPRRPHRDVRAPPRAPERPHRGAAVHVRPRLHHREGDADGVGAAAGSLPRAPVLDRALFHVYGSNFHAYRAFMLLISALMFCAIWLLLTRTRIGLVIQAALTHPEMVGALGHNVPRVFTHRLRGRLDAGRPRRGHRRQLPGHRAVDGRHHGADRVRGGRVRRAGLAGRLLHRLADHGAACRPSRWCSTSRSPTCSRGWASRSTRPPRSREVLTIPLPRVGALLPYLMLILVLLIKPRGLMGTRDT